MHTGENGARMGEVGVIGRNNYKEQEGNRGDELQKNELKIIQLQSEREARELAFLDEQKKEFRERMEGTVK